MEPFKNLGTHSKGGAVSPHKPLMLLLALGRIRQGLPRLFTFADVEKDAGDLLEVCGKGRKPQYPFWHLREDADVWEIAEDAALVRQLGGSNEPPMGALRKAHAGIPAKLHTRLARDAAAFDGAVSTLVDYLPKEHRAAVLKRCGLAGTSKTPAPVPAADAKPSKPTTVTMPWGADPEANKAVELAAVKAVADALEADGWTVESREAEKAGFDLEARRGKAVRHVEVKGLSGPAPRFAITRNELRAARMDPAWELAIVTSARTASRQVEWVDAAAFLAGFTLEPTQYVATRHQE